MSDTNKPLEGVTELEFEEWARSQSEFVEWARNQLEKQEE